MSNSQLIKLTKCVTKHIAEDKNSLIVISAGEIAAVYTDEISIKDHSHTVIILKHSGKELPVKESPEEVLVAVNNSILNYSKLENMR